MTGFVACLRCQSLGGARLVAVAIDFLLRLREITLGRIQRARRVAFHLRRIGLRNQPAGFVQDAIANRRHFDIAKQYIGLCRSTLGVFQIVLFERGGRFTKTLIRFLPLFGRELRSAGIQGIAACGDG